MFNGDQVSCLLTSWELEGKTRVSKSMFTYSFVQSWVSIRFSWNTHQGGKLTGEVRIEKGGHKNVRKLDLQEINWRVSRKKGRRWGSQLTKELIYCAQEVRLRLPYLCKKKHYMGKIQQSDTPIMISGLNLPSSYVCMCAYMRGIQFQFQWPKKEGDESTISSLCFQPRGQIIL